MPQGEILRRFAPQDDNSGCSTSHSSASRAGVRKLDSAVWSRRRRRIWLKSPRLTSAGLLSVGIASSAPAAICGRTPSRNWTSTTPGRHDGDRILPGGWSGGGKRGSSCSIPASRAAEGMASAMPALSISMPGIPPLIPANGIPALGDGTPIRWSRFRPNEKMDRRSRWNTATTGPVWREMLRDCWRQRTLIGASRMACIGCWISPLESPSPTVWPALPCDRRECRHRGEG